MPGSRDAARVLADLAGAAYLRGQYAEMREWARQIEPAAEDDGAVRRSVHHAARRRRRVRGRGRGRRRGALAVALPRSAAPARRSSPPRRSCAGGLLGPARARAPARGLAVARRVARRRAGGGNGLAAIPHDLADVLALGLLGRMAEAEPVADEAEQAARVSGNPQLVQWSLWMRAWVLMERGRLDAALAAAAESVELAEELDDSASADVARAVLGAVLGARGEHERGRELLAAYEIDHGWICRWAPVLVESDLALGDLDAAREHAAAGGGARAGDRDGGRAGRGGPGAGARRPRRRRGAAGAPRSRWRRRRRRTRRARRSRRRATGSSPAAGSWPPIPRRPSRC